MSSGVFETYRFRTAGWAPQALEILAGLKEIKDYSSSGIFTTTGQMLVGQGMRERFSEDLARHSSSLSDTVKTLLKAIGGGQSDTLEIKSTEGVILIHWFNDLPNFPDGSAPSLVVLLDSDINVGMRRIKVAMAIKKLTAVLVEAR